MDRPLTLRVKARNGQHILKDLTQDTTVQDLQSRLANLTRIPVGCLRILHGFPPKPVDLSHSQHSLNILKLQSGDTLIVEEDAEAKSRAEATRQELVTQQIQDQCQNQQGILTRRVVPANNSCLFTSIDYVMEERASVNLASAKPLRKLIANAVAGDRTTYSEAVLGKSNSEYCRWIRNDESWGGAIEISILSKHFNLEIDVVDTQSGRVDRFGEDQNFTRRVLLLYDGIHYDPLVMESLDPSFPVIQSIFSSNDDGILVQAQEIASEAKSSRQYTDVTGFALRCLICQKQLTGQAEAQLHAKNTGHINFGEV